MNHFRQIILVTIFLSPLGILLAQHGDYKPLRVGDKMPSYTFINMMNYPTEKVKFSDFKGKLIILDFWSTSCASCIESWPKLVRLQKEFNNEIQIILINPWQDEARVRQLMNKRKEVLKLDIELLPATNTDKNLLKLFPLSGLPHVVWIDREGVVRSITGGLEVTRKNVASMLSDAQSKLSQKINNDEYVILREVTKPLYVNGYGGNLEPGALLGQSTFSKAKDRYYFPIQLVANESDGYGIIGRESILELYRFAYTHPEKLKFNERLRRNRIVLDVKDPKNYVAYFGGGFDINQMYNYQLISPYPATRELLLRMMQKDLKRYVGLDVKWEKRKVKCLVFTAEDKTLLQPSRDEMNQMKRYEELGKSYLGRREINDVSFKVMSWPMEEVVQWMENQVYTNSSFPIIDETGCDRISVAVETNVRDYLSLDEALYNKYKMHFTLQEREIEMLMLSEPDEYIFPYIDYK